MAAGVVAERGRRGVAELLECFERNDLLLFASAIAFQMLTAVVPMALFVLGLLGFCDLGSVWADQARPHIVGEVSPAVMSVIDDTVDNVLGSKQAFWASGGALLAIWQLSGAVRAAMDALNRVYGATEGRSRAKRYATSLSLAFELAALSLAATAVVTLGPLLVGHGAWTVDALLFVVRWSVAGVLLLVSIGVVVHHGPDHARSLGWVTLGSAIVVGVWVLTTIAFALYLTEIASYGSLFSNLATVVVLLGYLYATVIAFLTGVQIDALLHDHSCGTPESTTVGR